MTSSPDGDAPGTGVAQAEPVAPAASSPAPSWGLPLLVLIVGMFMSVLDLSIVNVAIPVIRKDFGVSTEDIQWISTVYSLTEGIMVPVSAWLGAKVGLKRLYITLIILFTTASALCGMATGLFGLIVFRGVQAIPGGVLPVTCLSILYRIVPREKIGAAMGLYGLGVVVAPGVGPTLGGYLVEHVNWRVIFYINVPVGILGAIAAIMVLKKIPAEPAKPFDLAGFACIAGSLFSLLLALEEGKTWGWTSYPILILFAVAINLMALFIAVELQVEHPMLNLRVFKHWPFVNSLLLISVMSVGLFAVLFYIPSFLQGTRGYTPWQAGLVLLPQALVMMVLMPLAGQFYDRFGARWPAIIGILLTGSGIMFLARINVDITETELIIGMVTMAGGLAIGMMPIMTSGISSVPPSLTDSGSAFNTGVQRVSAALGLAVLTGLVSSNRAQFMADRSALLEGSGADAHPRILQMQQQGEAGLLPLWQELSSQVQAQAYSNAFFAAGCVTLAGVFLALMLRSGPPTSGADKPVAH